MIRLARFVALAALLLAPAAAAWARREDCVPLPVVAAIAHGAGVRVVQLGREVAGEHERHSDPPGTFFGYRRLAAYEVRGRAAEALRAAFGRPGRYDCGVRTGGLDFGGDRRGVLGIEFDTPRGPVRVVLDLPAGSGRIGFASGVRFDFVLTAAAQRDWWRFLDAFAGARRSRPEDFLAAMLEAQGPAAPEPVPPVQANPPEVDSLLCSADEAKRTEARLRAECPDPPIAAEDFPDPWEDLPDLVTRVDPVYPDEARRAGLEGTVVVQALLGCDGHVWCMRLANSIPGLDAAALRAVRQWVFAPATLHGGPLTVWVAVPVRFSLP